MKKLFFLFIIIILGVLQPTLLDYFKVFSVKPDLLLISVVIASLVFDLRWAFVLSVFAGFFKDIFGTSTFGINTIMFALWSFLIVRLSKEISIDSDTRRIALLFIITAIHNTITGLIFIYSGRLVPLGIFLRVVIVESIYTAIVLPLIFNISKATTYVVAN